MTAKAELDEFRVLKARLDKQQGIQQRWSKSKLREVRKMSDVDVEKYDQWVVVDEDVVTPQYNSEYRGAIQNRVVENVFMPLFSLSYMPYVGGVRSLQIVVPELEDFNHNKKPIRKIYLTCKPSPINEKMTKSFFNSIDSISTSISASHDIHTAADLLIQRAVAHVTTHNYSEAINDLNDYLRIDSTNVLVYWERAYCHAMMSEYASNQGTDSKMRLSVSLDDLKHALSFNNENAYLHYNIATVYAIQKEYHSAIDHYRKAIQLNANLAEAYYNLGLVHIFNNDRKEGIKDLSKAGELGLYDAYSIMKRYTSEKEK